MFFIVTRYIKFKKQISLKMNIGLQKPLSRRCFQSTLSLNLGQAVAQHKKGDAGVPDGTVSSTVYTMSQTSWMTLKSRMGRSHNKDGKRKNSKKDFKWKLLHHKTSGKTKKQMGGCGPEGCVTAAGDKGMEEKS